MDTGVIPTTSLCASLSCELATRCSTAQELNNTSGETSWSHALLCKSQLAPDPVVFVFFFVFFVVFFVFFFFSFLTDWARCSALLPPTGSETSSQFFPYGAYILQCRSVVMRKRVISSYRFFFSFLNIPSPGSALQENDSIPSLLSSMYNPFYSIEWALHQNRIE